MKIARLEKIYGVHHMCVGVLLVRSWYEYRGHHRSVQSNIALCGVGCDDGIVDSVNQVARSTGMVARDGDYDSGVN